jgi:hypothetical protein
MASTPLHQQEQANHASGSSGQHTPFAVPPIPSTSSTSHSLRQPTTFNGQTYHHLPPHLAALVNNQPSLPSSPAPQHRGRYPRSAASRAASTPVSLDNLLYLFF